METSIISIGNSKGIRLSKTVIEKYNFQDKIELILENDYLILKPKPTPRMGWEKSFKEMNQNGDDLLLMPDVFEKDNLEEWN
ncbi:MAG: AbrB/MazE/SpoVT family DNA-binding domain-containing protein [Bacteroidetes bacterium]|nr:MAG: AbrB/MazE/SpoVT family DNA-binding domain-containing protein [Bacteroidota bacterium]